MVGRVYVMLCYYKDCTEPSDVTVFEDSDLAYDTQKDYQKHSDFWSVELYQVPFYQKQEAK